MNVPIVMATSYIDRPGESSEPIVGFNGEVLTYSRGDGTDGVAALEQAVGALEAGVAVAFGSGMAAISSVLDGLGPGARVVAPDDLYQGVAQILEAGADRWAWKVTRLPVADTAAWVDCIASCDMAWVESPSNPTLEVADLGAIGRAANDAGVPLVVDNTFATPLGQQPLAFGATYSVHSATKFIGGHSDLLAGVVIASSESAAAPIRDRRLFGGAVIGSLEAFLALRGLRTLPLRLERSQQNALELASRLASDDRVSEIRYPGLSTDPGYSRAIANGMKGGAIVSFLAGRTAQDADTMVGRLQLIHPATSLGGVESTIERRAKHHGQEHLAPSLVRMSVGIEHVEDLWADIDQALG